MVLGKLILVYLYALWVLCGKKRKKLYFFYCLSFSLALYQSLSKNVTSSNIAKRALYNQTSFVHKTTFKRQSKPDENQIANFRCFSSQWKRFLL